MAKYIIFLTVLLSSTSSYSFEYDPDTRGPMAQMKVDSICGLGSYSFKTPNDTDFLLCEILQKSDRMTIKIKDLEKEIEELRKNR